MTVSLQVAFVADFGGSAREVWAINDAEAMRSHIDAISIFQHVWILQWDFSQLLQSAQGFFTSSPKSWLVTLSGPVLAAACCRQQLFCRVLCFQKPLQDCLPGLPARRSSLHINPVSSWTFRMESSPLVFNQIACAQGNLKCALKLINTSRHQNITGQSNGRALTSMISYKASPHLILQQLACPQCHASQS